MIVQQ